MGGHVLLQELTLKDAHQEFPIEFLPLEKWVRGTFQQVCEDGKHKDAQDIWFRMRIKFGESHVRRRRGQVNVVAFEKAPRKNIESCKPV